MKVLLVGNYKLDAIESMDRFASMLETYLSKCNIQVRVIRPRLYFGKIILYSNLLKKWLGYIDKLILFPFQLQKAASWADIVHICDHGNAIYTKYLQKIPHLVTCHDLFAIRAGLGEFPEHKTGWTGKKLQQMMLKGLNQAQMVVCVSEQTKNDLLRLSSLSENRISVISMGLNYPYAPMQTTEAKEILASLGIPANSNFILHVGANHWYKNRIGVLSIFYELMLRLQQTNFYLVMVGKPFTDEMHQLIKKYNMTEKVIELVAVDNEHLQALYSSATALLFPSLHEGFGWPIIEAQACGCAVFTSNRPPMNIVGGEAAIYIDPKNPQAAAEKIIYYLPNLENFKTKSLINSQKFRTEKMISEYIDIYQKILINKQ
ncbi:glycosyltransferase family 4 protein [Fischerella thermalis]|uniref:Glycosyl transferase group 1 n=1 Tax=Fischerella thermalis JSC-11 TaxID=741277 RepID=G6FXG7_9CYAN|nr:glycosyltransferase family 1 protein [Fischerella thermalis]EHC10627.1 glycosyl transferase group 1 [Fischerella thermalis JSC-11]PLZ05744.1 mannosyltransferase [Fischerella thermalis WC1110]PLZ32244.1 mannosyltransferase [Fischerella thermalis WC558]PLZ40725.1 mannosyltransferase [Fischerella thermalis WC538]PLZ41039.1 mannosyltransferase [Fischerella thermalis WC527]